MYSLGDAVFDLDTLVVSKLAVDFGEVEVLRVVVAVEVEEAGEHVSHVITNLEILGTAAF